MNWRSCSAEMIGLRLVQTVSDQVVQLLPVIQLQREQTQLGFEVFVSHSGTGGGKFEGFVELLQIIDQQMRPWPIRPSAPG